MAPAALGAGAGVAGAAAYNHHNNGNEQKLQEQAAREAELVDDGGAQAGTSRYEPNTLEPSLEQQAAKEAELVDDGGADLAGNRGLATAPTNSTPGTVDNAPLAAQPAANGPNSTFLSYPSTAGSGVAGSSDLSAAPLDGALGGLESRGAHETGHIFPSVVRHNTDISVSQLHVPGSFPKRN